MQVLSPSSGRSSGSCQRGFARVGRPVRNADARKIAPAKPVRDLDPGNIAVTVFRPHDPNDGWGIFRAIRRGPVVYSISSVHLDRRDGTKYDGVSDAHMEQRIRQAHHQDDFKITPVFSLPSIDQKDHRGVMNTQKLTVGASVIANFDLYGSSYNTGFIYGSVASLWRGGGVGELINFNTHMNQGYGTIAKLHSDTNGEVRGAEVAFLGLFRQDLNDKIKLRCALDPEVPYDLEIDGESLLVQYSRHRHLAYCPEELLTAHSTFRNVFLKTDAYDLRWEIAMIWPEVLDIEADIKFLDSDGVEIRGRPVSITSLVYAGDQLQVRGQPVSVLDPTNALPGQFYYGQSEETRAVLDKMYMMFLPALLVGPILFGTLT